MTFRVVFRGLLLALAIFVLQAACCGGGEELEFEVTNYEFQAVKGTYSSLANKVEFPIGSPEIGSGESVAAAYVGFSFRPDVTYLSMAGGSGMNAYACSPLPNRPTQLIHRIRIRSTNDFISDNATIQAGMLLNSVFTNYENQFVFEDDLVTGTVPASESGFVLILSEPVATTQTHAFSFEVTLSDSSKFELTSHPITITAN
ncbi:MAG TPA: hypothetical protein VEB86_12075 [Chryseosolibacter sp.]|nr:hypothetical protein [Chryseosolibacter sp.]